ncbi:MAG: hypothetical protein L3K26_13540 [Candidatus Hydrogenedentes bacterium]|nr:hypothetical protein [Candidatus Hydrogenedentota bacterium]
MKNESHKKQLEICFSVLFVIQDAFSTENIGRKRTQRTQRVLYSLRSLRSFAAEEFGCDQRLRYTLLVVKYFFSLRLCAFAGDLLTMKVCYEMDTKTL